MAILIDSASRDDLATAAGLGFVGGFTTNPILMARVTDEPLAHFARLLAAFPHGPAFYQPTGDAPAMAEEARTAAAFDPERVVIKLPATLDGIGVAATLVADGLRCALTAVYAPAQATLAHEVGCAWAIPYVDRATRQGADGLALVEGLAVVLSRLRSGTRVLAASLKTGQQAADAVLRGADDLTAPLEVLRDLATHPLSEAAARGFDAAWTKP